MIQDFNPLLFLLDFFNILADFARILWVFLFDEVTLGTWTFRPVFVLGASTIIVLIIARLIKQFVPLT